jgi:hypothetical protein
MAPGNPSEKPVTRQDSTPSSPSETGSAPPAPSNDRAAVGTSSSTDGSAPPVARTGWSKQMSHEQMRAFCERVGMSVPQFTGAIRRRPEQSQTTERADGEEARAEPARSSRRTGGRPRKPRENDLEPPVTRGYVAKVLDVDVSTVRRLENRGQLHPTIGAHGVRYFKMHEVLALNERRRRTARGRTVDVRLAAFELFRRGADWRDVAIKLRYDPYDIHRLWELYSRDHGGSRNVGK